MAAVECILRKDNQRGRTALPLVCRVPCSTQINKEFVKCDGWRSRPLSLCCPSLCSLQPTKHTYSLNLIGTIFDTPPIDHRTFRTSAPESLRPSSCTSLSLPSPRRPPLPEAPSVTLRRKSSLRSHRLLLFISHGRMLTSSFQLYLRSW